MVFWTCVAASLAWMVAGLTYWRGGYRGATSVCLLVGAALLIVALWGLS